MLFLRSSITGVGTTYTKVNFSMSIYIKPVVLDKTQTSIKIALAGGSPVE